MKKTLKCTRKNWKISEYEFKHKLICIEERQAKQKAEEGKNLKVKSTVSILHTHSMPISILTRHLYTHFS